MATITTTTTLRSARNRIDWWRIGFWTLVALITIGCLLPFAWAVITSLKSNTEVYRSPAYQWPSAVWTRARTAASPPSRHLA